MAQIVKIACEKGKRKIAEVRDLVIDFFVGGNFCLVCTRELTVDESVSLPARYFCSSYCYRMYLIEARNCERWEKCLKDGCNRPRCCNEYKVFDYCSRTHAIEHQQWLAHYWSKDATGHGHCGHSSSHASHTGSHQIRKKSLTQSVDFDGSSTAILFYRRGEPYFEFTNFAQYPIVVDELQYPTSEHYFQSQKLIGTPYVAHICKLPTAREAFEFPRKPHVSRWIRHDWEHVKDDVMFRALVAKFRQHRKLQFMLLNTGNRELVEHSPYDSYWGDGPDGKGLNKLGKLLMRVRDLLVFIRSHGDHVLHKDHTTVSATANSSSQQSSSPSANIPPPDRRHVEADGDGDGAPRADGCGVVPRNDSLCSTSIPGRCVGTNELKPPPAGTCSSSTPGGQVAPPQPISRSSSTPEDEVGATPQSVNRSLSTPGDHTEANEHASHQAAQSPGNSSPSLDSSGPVANKADSVPDSSPMEVCQDNNSGARPQANGPPQAAQSPGNSSPSLDSSGLLADKADSVPMEVGQDNGNGARPHCQETSQAEQSALASTEQDGDIVKMQLEKKLEAEKMDYTLV